MSYKKFFILEASPFNNGFGCGKINLNTIFKNVVRFVNDFAYRDSLRRLECEQLAIGQLHWSTANYAPLQEKVLWDGLAAMYNEVVETSYMNLISLQ